jgi:mannose-6-phosphate isomerase-like protein (cupin superfamily)
MKQPFIINNSESDEYYFEEGCFIWELSNSENDETLSIARARLTPNTATRLHKLTVTVERYVILDGVGEVILGEAQTPTVVGIGDVVLIPADHPQAIRNIGEGDLTFLVICTPRFTVNNYSDC